MQLSSIRRYMKMYSPFLSIEIFYHGYKGSEFLEDILELIGKTLDYLLIGRGSYVLVEIKSAVLRLPSNIAGYPDAPTSRISSVGY